MEALLQVEQLSISLGGVEVVEAVDVQLRPGECIALFGASGCGKTTILRAIAGLIESYSGKIRRPPELAYLFQEPRLLPWLTVWENIRLVAPELPQAELETLCADLGLSRRDGQKYPAECSGGMQQRIALARAWFSGGRLWLLDEPFSALDPHLRRAMQVRIQRLMETGCGAVLVSHDPEEALRLAHRIYFLGGKPSRLRQILDLPDPYAGRSSPWLQQHLQREALFHRQSEWEE